MKDFQVMNNRKMQARARGKIAVSGSIQAPYVSGEVTVNQARMYYPAWFEDDTAVELSSQPFFIISEDTARVDTAGAMRFQRRKKLVEKRFTESAFYKNIRGELAVYFPRNAWLRSEDANIEIEGELVAVKEGPEITLFGSCSTIRGYYELFGNRFQIQEGELVFNGDPDYNPEVSIDAVYTFRDLATRETHKFKVVVSGTLFYPEFRFLLDGQEARQEDVLSILLFGQSFDNLSIGQKSGISQKTSLNEEATGLLTSQMLSRLTSELGKELNLDVVQIESGQGLAETKVRIGKYVTPDVFVSVSQDFGAEGNRRVELEYEIPKKILFFRLLLQAVQERKGNTGLDVIWKIEW
ncbi:MAG: translocation/assembly module TamB [Calditrichaeota bacterium]|nr:MAG: translocation/assembly module TamB [Calditrichota bacterium]